MKAGLKIPPAYIPEHAPGTDTKLLIGRYEAEAVRINRWINIGFNGLVEAVIENERLLSEYEAGLKTYQAECEVTIAAADDDQNAAARPKKWWQR